MRTILKRIGLILLIVAAVIFWGRWLLDLFGFIKYDVPLSQDTRNIVQIDLLDTSGQEYVVLYSIVGDEINSFLDDFMQLDAGRYANDPPTMFDDHTVRICYADGGYDLLGGMVVFYSSTGESLNTRGWYHLSASDIDDIFEKYLV